MFSGTKKLLLVALFAALLVVLVNAVWWFNYQKTERLLDQQLSRRLAAAAQTAAVGIDPFDVDLLGADDIGAYTRAISRLERIRAADSLSEIFIIDENNHYLATTTVESDSTYFAADLHARLIDSLFFGADLEVVLTPTYRSGPLYLKTAFAPLRGLDGFVIAVLGVEASVDYFDSLSALRRNLYWASALSLLGGVALGFVFLLLLRRINRAEEQLFLRETHAHLGRMVAVVAHELRNPLMIIRGSAERLRKKAELPEAGFVVEEVDRLNEIVSGYLDFARAGGSLLSNDGPSVVDLKQLAENTRKHLLQKYSDVAVQWLGPDEFPALTVKGYPRSLRQVLLNLLINGVEACQAVGGPIAVGLRIDGDRNKVRLSVIDRGGGFSRQDLKKIFEPFYSTKRSGSGLGLYLSREIVSQMGRRLEIKSEPDRETEVIIVLPQSAKSE